MTSQRISRFFLAFCVTAVSVAACSQPEDPQLPGPEAVALAPDAPPVPAAERDNGDAIVFGSIGDASNLLPMLASDSASHQIAGYLFDGLVSYDKTLSVLEPRLAESWEVSEDGLTITFVLRKGLEWSDGDPFDVADIKFGFDKIRDPKTLTSYAEDYKQVSKFEVLDDFSFRVTYDKPFAPALASWGNMVVLPSHLLADVDINETPLAREPVTIGSYTLEKWETNTSLSLRSNHDYYRGRPHVERVVYRVIPDQATQFLELKSGGLDSMGLTPLQYRRQTSTRQFNEDFTKYRYVSGGYTYLGYNLTNPLFEDVRVRRALTHAIDKQEIVDTVLLGLGSIAETPYRPGTAWINQTLVDEAPFPYDPERARALFAEAGWEDTNGDGVLDKDGERFTFRILTNSGNDLRLKTATVIQQRLKEVGVAVEVRVLEWSAFINDFVDKRNFDALVLGWSLSLDPDQYDIWHSSKTEFKQFNFVGFKNDEVDDLLEKGRRLFDTDERKAIYDRIQEIIAQEQPYTFLYVPDALPTVHARFRGIDEAPAGISWNFHEWYVPEGQQKYSLEP
ncbi:MAG: peptide/nickel transport system substrate-binding protein [Hyphomicrobiaceae bacterium]|jgi:peptide/nickel transport system substrate-binding protein